MLLPLFAVAAATLSPNSPPPAPSASDVQAPVMVIDENWDAAAGGSLSGTLTSWAERAGWKLIWESDADFRLGAGATISGDFPKAASDLITSFSTSTPRIRAVFYSGNKVLRVWTERVEP